MKKICSKCRINKPIIDFYNHKSQKDGLSSICKLCDKKQHKQWLSKQYKECKNCEKIISYHGVRCHSCENKRKHKLGLTGYHGKLKEILTKEILVDLYINKNKNIIEISKILKCAHGSVYDYLKKYNIKILHSKGSYYKNIWMRSSWEVAYAKYLDRKDIKWVYEPETFDLGKYNYRPDFYLPENDTYIEIKGRWYKNAKTKVNLFKQIYNIHLLILEGINLKQMGVL
jgi:hypothetical protein